MDTTDRITAPIGEFCKLAGIGRSLVYEMIGDGRIESILIGKRRLIVLDSYRRLIERQPHSRGADLGSSGGATPERQGSRYCLTMAAMATANHCLRSAAPIDFAAVNRAALGRLPDMLARWLAGGRIEGREYVVRNPKRLDRRPGSFKVNLDTGRWADFATGDKGGDPISLAAYLASCSQLDAARRLAAMLGSAVDG